MKGVVFNLFEDVISRNHGVDMWDALLDTAELDGAYTSLGSYPDDNLQALVAAASQALGMTSGEVLHWFGREAMPTLAQRYPSFFSAHQSASPFVVSVNSIIHPEVRKVYPGADVPTFTFRDAPDGTLLMGYRSPRRLCALAHGFIAGAADYYGETLKFEHLECMHDGDPQCLCQLSFSAGGSH